MGPRAADRAAAGPRLPYVIAPPVRRRSHTLAPGRAHAPTKSTHKCRQALLARRPSHQPTALPLQEHPHSHPHPHHGQARRVQLRPQCHSARRPADPGWRQPSPPEPPPLHLDPLPPGCRRRRRRHRHPHHRRHPGTSRRRLALSIATSPAHLPQIVGVRVLLWILSLFIDMDHSQLDETVVNGLHFLEHSVLQVPFFLMTLMRYVTPTLDEMFMDSLRWVDETYVQKHKTDDPHNLRAMYYPNLEMYPDHAPKPQKEKKPFKEAATIYATKQGRKAAISLGVLALSYMPYVGRFVLPAASFYTFKKSVGTQPAALIFATSLLFPRRYLVSFLQAYFSSRTLMRELLEPYFSRVRYTKEQKKLWFRDRAGVLFGFGLGFYVFVKIPLVGVLIYGLAEASTAYLITKITEPPLPPAEAEKFKEDSLRWKNKHEFLSLPLQHMDEYNLSMHKPKAQSEVRQTPRKTFS